MAALLFSHGEAQAAIAASQVTQNATTNAATTYATAAFTPVANQLYLMWTVQTLTAGGPPTTPTVTCANGLNMVQVNTVAFDSTGTPLTRLTLFRAMKPSGLSNGTCTISWGQTTAGHGYVIDTFSGVDTSGTDGSGAVVQSITGATNNASANTGLSLALGALQTGSAVAGGFSNSVNSTTSLAAGTGYTAGTGVAFNNPATSLRTEWDVTGTTTVNMTQSATSNIGGIAAEVKQLPVTTLADGTNPSNATLAPGAAITDLDGFTLATNVGTDSVTGLTVTLTGTNSYQGLSEVRITSNDGGTTYFSAAANPSSNVVTFSGGSPIPVTTAATSFKIRITPKSHANMPAPPGATYTVGGTVTAFTSTNTHAGTDGSSAAVTIDNLSPNGATATSGTAGNGKTTLNWTTSSSTDFATTAGSVIYRWASTTAGAEVPAEGSTATVGSVNGTATVACVVSSARSTALSRVDGSGGSADCMTTALIAGQAYTYKVFQKDSSGNYDVGVTIGTFTAPLTTIGDGANPPNVLLAPGGLITDLDTFTLATSSGTDSITGLTVTLTGLNSYQGLSAVSITNNTGTTTYFSAAANPTGNVVTFSGGTPIPVGTAATSFKIRITPKSHANMPAPPGALYTVGGTVTAFTGTNAQTGADGSSATVTIDNQSPDSATATNSVAGTGSTTLYWTTSDSSDFATTSGTVIYRWASATAGTEVPVEGSTPAVGSTNGTATVACVVSSVASTALSSVDGSGGSTGCTTTALTTGQTYTYKVFQKDGSGNYDTGVTIGALSIAKSFTPDTIAVGGTSTLTITLTNSNNAAVSGVAFTDAYPAGLTNAATPGLTNTCGGTATAAANGASLSLAGGAVPANSSCTVTVSVTSAASGGYTNTTGALTASSFGGYTGPTASATLGVGMTCFTDNFADISNWSVGNVSGTFGNPRVVSNRLRLTDATSQVSTYAMLNRLFPAYGNKVVVEFNLYAYGGNGADGVGVILSDASIAPVAGAFGGSLGYAPKQASQGGDTTHVGFAGGWLGVGLDEFGNFSANTEGRSGGNAPGQIADSVAIRGSGDGYAGYAYMAGTGASISPGIDNAASQTPAPGYRYRITVDHSNAVNAWTTVERDIGDGNGYRTLVGGNNVLDAKAAPGQAAVPTNWFLSFTGATGTQTNIHEVENLRVCSNSQQTLSLDHVNIVHDGSALTCAPETITLKACAGSDCSVLYPGSVTVTLPTISGATWSANPVTFTGGQAQVTLSKGTTGNVTLGGTVNSPLITNSTVVCFDTATNDNTCTLVYSSNSCAFDAVEPGNNPSTPIYTKLVGTDFSLDVLALTAGAINTGYRGTVTVQVKQADSPAGSCSGTALTTTQNHTYTAGNAGRWTATFNSATASKDVRISIVSGTTTACSSDNFAIRPTAFTVTTPSSPNPLGANNPYATGNPMFIAGTDTGTLFELDAASVAGYTGAAALNNSRIQANTGAAIAGTVSGSFSAAPAATGTSSGTGFLYSEAGNFSFQSYGVYDDGSFANVDRNKSTPECFSDGFLGTATSPSNPNAANVNGKYGCYFGNTGNSNAFGRFVPDHFNTAIVPITPTVTPTTCSGTVSAQPAIPMACPAGLCSGVSGMVYSGQPFVVQVTAKNAADATVQNYQYSSQDSNGASYAKSITLSGVNAPGGSPLSVGALNALPGLTANDFSAGVAIKGTASNPAPYVNYTFTTTPTVPTAVYVRAQDSDGVTSLRASSSVEDGVEVVSGRSRIFSAYGSELLPLTMKMAVQFYDSDHAWVPSTTDNVTSFSDQLVAAGGNLVSQNVSGLNGGSALSVSGAGTFAVASGAGCFVLSAPSVTGFADFTINTPAYLSSVAGRATFGVYNKGNNDFIYMRERY